MSTLCDSDLKLLTEEVLHYRNGAVLYFIQVMLQNEIPSAGHYDIWTEFVDRMNWRFIANVSEETYLEYCKNIVLIANEQIAHINM